MNMQPAAVCFDLSASVQRLLRVEAALDKICCQEHGTQSRSDIIMQYLSGSRSMFLTPKKTCKPSMPIGKVKTCCGQFNV